MNEYYIDYIQKKYPKVTQILFGYRRHPYSSYYSNLNFFTSMIPVLYVTHEGCVDTNTLLNIYRYCRYFEVNVEEYAVNNVIFDRYELKEWLEENIHPLI